MARRPGIYSILNTIDGKRYVGSSVDVVRRLWVHRHLLRGRRHHSIHLQRAYDRDGEAAFSFAAIERCEQAALLAREQLWINYFDSVAAGYNICPVSGTRAGVPQPASVAIKIRSVHTGKPKSPAQRAKMSAAAKGRKKSPEHRQRLREAAQRQYADPAARAAAAVYGAMAASPRGRVTSDATRQKQSMAALARCSTPEAKAELASRFRSSSR